MHVPHFIIGGAMGAIITGYGVAGRPFYSLGYLNLSAFFIIAPVVMCIAPLGAKTSNKLPKHILKWVYVGFLIVVTTYMVYQLT